MSSPPLPVHQVLYTKGFSQAGRSFLRVDQNPGLTSGNFHRSLVLQLHPQHIPGPCHLTLGRAQMPSLGSPVEREAIPRLLPFQRDSYC